MGSLQLLVLATGSYQPTMPTKPFLFVLTLASQALSLPCPAPNSLCAISEAAACPSGELANSTICASCQECAREEAASGQRKRGELVSVPVGSSAVEKSV